MTLITVEGVLPCPRIRGPEDVGDELVDLLGGLPRETVMAISLGPNGRVLGLDVVALGSSWMACIEFRDVFAGVCRRGGAAIIAAHNHPSGPMSPSVDDIDFAVRLLDAGRILGVDVVDYLIITRESWRSLRESTHLWDRRERASG